MEDIQTIDASYATATLSSDGERLFWLSRQKDTEPVVDSMGRERRKMTLHMLDLTDGEQSVRARDLGPSDSLAACSGAVYVWGTERKSLVEIDPDGNASVVAEFETAAEGTLKCAGERLFYLGRTRPRQMGAAVFDPQIDDFAQIVNLDDPTHVALQRMQITEDGVWSLQHATRGWVMSFHPIDGELTETVLTDEKLILRWMARTDDWVAAAGPEGVYLFEGDEPTFVETEVPPDDLIVVDGKLAWVDAGMTDADGELVEPWRVQLLEPGADAPTTLLESDDRIASIVGGDWGCAALTQHTSDGLDDFIDGDVQTAILVARFD